MRIIVLIALLLTVTLSSAWADISYTPGRKALLITGTIGARDHCDAAEILVQHPDVRLAIVNSHGGDAWAGLQLARLFGRAGLTAVVPADGRALSAAGIAALGAPRLVLAGQLGLHAPYPATPGFPLASTMTGEARAEMTEVLTQSGLPWAQIQAALAMGPDQLLILSPGSIALRRHSIPVDRQQVLHVQQACSALMDLLGRPARRPT